MNELEWLLAFKCGLDWDICDMAPDDVVFKIRDEMAKLRYAHLEPGPKVLHESWPWLFPAPH